MQTRWIGERNDVVLASFERAMQREGLINDTKKEGMIDCRLSAKD